MAQKSNSISKAKLFQFYTIPAMPTFHPAFLLRQSAQKREAWRDFLAIQEKLEKIA